MISEAEAKQRVDQLRVLLEKHRILYHVHDSPEISDEVYDSLLSELAALESLYPNLSHPLSPTRRVGGEPLPHFEKVRHELRQWSFDNVFSFEELLAWEERNNKILEKAEKKEVYSYMAEMKIDGLKVILSYKNGDLVCAATRGDGVVGENITENIKTVKSIPLTLTRPYTMTVIGEAWMRKKDLDAVNKEREKEGLPLYSNTRNLSAGTLRQLDSRIVAKRNIQIFAYDIETEGIVFTQEDELALLTELGFLVNPERRFCQNIEEVQTFYDEWTERRMNEEYGIDGLVVKVNERRVWDALGYTAKSPRGGIAYKFPAEEATSTLLSVTYQVGRTGAVTPVAELSPTQVSGSLVSRATLHNKDEIERLDLYEGDTVGVRKAGDVIPEIFTVYKDLRKRGAKKVSFPSKCPECESLLSQDIDGKTSSVAFYCKNAECPAKHLENLIHFVSKKGFNIEGLGEKIIEFFHDVGIVTDCASIFDIKKEDVEGLEGFGEKSAENLVREIEKAKSVELHRLLFALGIRHVGEETSKDLAKSFQTLRDILNARKEELALIHGVGEKVAESIVLFTKDKAKEKMLERLMGRVGVVNTLHGKASHGRLVGQTIVLTGTYSTFSREEAKSIVESEGGKVASSVSKKTTVVVAGDKPGSKVDDARALGVPVVGEEYLRG